MPLSLNRPSRYPPRKPRQAAVIESSLFLPDDREVAIRIRNISAEGFMGECRSRVDPETALGLSIPGYGIVRANIRWSEGDTVGGRFMTPLDLERLPVVAD